MEYFYRDHQQCQFRQRVGHIFYRDGHGTLETYERRVLKGKYLPDDD